MADRETTETKDGAGAVPAAALRATLQRIAALAATGAHFANGAEPGEVHHRARYEEIRALIVDLLAAQLQVSGAAVSAALPRPERGYATPLVDVRAALVEPAGVLLVRERSDGRWTLPGGFAETGVSAARNAEREMHEEAGLVVEVTRLYAIVHKASHAYDEDLRDFYKLLFLCRRAPGEDSTPVPCGLETTDVGYFARGALPELSTGRIIAEHVDLAFEAQAQPDWSTVIG